MTRAEAAEREREKAIDETEVYFNLYGEANARANFAKEKDQ